MVASDQLNCQQLVELVTDYFEGALPEVERTRFEQHIIDCGKCVAYLHQMRDTIRLTGKIAEESLDPDARDALLTLFRNWKSA